MVKKSIPDIKTTSAPLPSSEPLDGLEKINPKFQEFFRQTCTQAEFGKLVRISQQAVSDLVGRGVLIPGQSRHTWLNRYLTHLRETALERQRN